MLAIHRYLRADSRNCVDVHRENRGILWVRSKNTKVAVALTILSAAAPIQNLRSRSPSSSVGKIRTPRHCTAVPPPPARSDGTRGKAAAPDPRIACTHNTHRPL